MKIAIGRRQVGRLLGQGGQRSQQLQKKYGVKIYLTGADDTLPGTRNRLLCVQGELSDCMMMLGDALEFISAKLPHTDEYRISVVFPLAIVGILFGEGGCAIKNIQERTGAHISAQSADSILLQQNVRRFDITGSLQQIAEGYLGLLSLCVTTKEYEQFSDVLPTEHTDSKWVPKFVSAIPQNEFLAKAVYTVQLGVPKELIPQIVGKSSANLIRLVQLSGDCQIDIPKNEYVEGTSLRKVILHGNFKDVMKAQAGLEKIIRTSVRAGVVDQSAFAKPKHQV